MPKPSLKSLLERSEGLQASYPVRHADFTPEERVLFEWWHKLGLLECRLYQRAWMPFDPAAPYHPAWQYRFKRDE